MQSNRLQSALLFSGLFIGAVSVTSAMAGPIPQRGAQVMPISALYKVNIEGLSSNIPEDLSREGNLYVLDYTLPVNRQLKLGGHLYYLDVNRNTVLPAEPPGCPGGLAGGDPLRQGGDAYLSGFLILLFEERRFSQCSC